MKLRMIIIIAALVAVLVAGVSAFRLHALRASVDVDGVIAKALVSETRGNYVADVVTSVRHNGKTITTEATLVSVGSNKKVEYKGKNPRILWSLTKENVMYTYMPRKRCILVSETGGLLAPRERVKLLLSNYEGRLDSTDKVAGRGVYVISLLPKQEGHPSKKLWIDKSRYTILKSVDYGTSGEERGSMEVKRIAYNVPLSGDRLSIPSDSAVKRVRVCESVDQPQLSELLGFRLSEPGYIPSGYRLEGYHIFSSQCMCSHKSAQITYTDGLNVISVFETPRMEACCAKGCNREEKGKHGGGCAVQGCEMAKTGQVVLKDKTVVVVGDLLPEEITKIAESVR